MERRRDYRHPRRYSVTLKCRQTDTILDGIATCDVSASGLRFLADHPHGLREGDRLEVRLQASLHDYAIPADFLDLGTNAVVVRVEERAAALRFEAPLSY